MGVSRLSPQHLALSTWNKAKLAAYISSYHHHNHANPNNNEGASYGGNEVTCLKMHSNGSILNIEPTYRGQNSQKLVPSGTVKNEVKSYLTSGVPLKTNNRFKLYRALMRQNKPELVKLAQIIHGHMNNFKYDPENILPVEYLARPQFGQKWKRL